MIKTIAFDKEGMGSFTSILIGDGFLSDERFFVGTDIANILQHSNLTQAIKRLCSVGADYKIFKQKENEELFFILKEQKIIGARCGSITLLTTNGVIKLAFNNETFLEKIKFIDWLKELNILDKNCVLFKNTEEQEFGSILVPFFKEQGIDVKRQYTIDKYRLDFFIERFNFCIELDGLEHDFLFNRHLDSVRDSYLHEKGIFTIRVKNSDNYGKSLAIIQDKLREWMIRECLD